MLPVAGPVALGSNNQNLGNYESEICDALE